MAPTSETTSGDLLVDLRAGIAILTLNRPEKRMHSVDHLLRLFIHQLPACRAT